MKHTAIFLSATVTLITGLIAPVIPDNLTWVESYEYVCVGHLQQVIGLDSVWRDPEYTPEPCSGHVAISMFDDGNGNHVFVKTPLQQYHNMALTGGHDYNPTKEAFKSVLQTYLLSATPAQAEVIRGPLFPASGSGTSLTFPIDINATSTNNVLFVAGFCNGTVGDSVGSITYNGKAATIVAKAIAANNGSLGAGYLINPTPNRNNVVISCGVSAAAITGRAINFTQAYQASVDGVSATPVGTASTTFYNAIYVTNPGSTHVSVLRWDTGNAVTSWTTCTPLEATAGLAVVANSNLQQGSDFCGGVTTGSNSVVGIGVAISRSAQDFSTF